MISVQIELVKKKSSLLYEKSVYPKIGSIVSDHNCWLLLINYKVLRLYGHNNPCTQEPTITSHHRQHP